LGDKATVRRRAVVALGRFGGDARRALEQALRDRDWQVRELAEQLLRAEAGPSVHEQVTD
jgi:HEAT repeat protein